MTRLSLPCFLDSSKAFDRVNHRKLFAKLREAGVAPSVADLLEFWYLNQEFCVRWGGLTSDGFTVGNGVRQGSILSPFLYAFYLNSVSSWLSNLNIGCRYQGSLVNHIMYADDVCVFAHSASGLEKLLDGLVPLAGQLDIVFNPLKSACMTFTSKNFKFLAGRGISLADGTVIPKLDKVIYLGVSLCSDLSDDCDIGRQRRATLARGNLIGRKFVHCSIEVKKRLFLAHVASFYAASLWRKFNAEVLRSLKVAYNDVFRLLFGYPRYEHISPHFVELGIPTFVELRRKANVGFCLRVIESVNGLLHRSPAALLSWDLSF